MTALVRTSLAHQAVACRGMKTKYVRFRFLDVVMPNEPGEKALINLSVQPKLHAIGRKPLSEALSPKAVLELQSNLNAVLEKLVLRLEGFAESGQVGVIFCCLFAVILLLIIIPALLSLCWLTGVQRYRTMCTMFSFQARADPTDAKAKYGPR